MSNKPVPRCPGCILYVISLRREKNEKVDNR